MAKAQHSQQGKCLEFDVLVIGSGIAGMHFCHQLLALQPNLSIAIVSKGALTEGSSRWAQGGIAAVNSKDDSLESHIEDTLQAGDGLCYQPAVEFIIRQAPDAIGALENYGIDFHHEPSGEYTLAKEGGHSHRRIFNCGDKTGLTIIDALEQATRQQHQITLYEDHIAVNLISHYHPHRTDIQGEICGAYVLDTSTGYIHTFAAKCTILATGGAGKTYRYTSNPMVATGDGVAMAYRAGARVGNMEFYQFHPTLLHHPQINNFLISEAVRGEGAKLICPETNKRFMSSYAPEAMELATRDVVSRAIFNEIEANQHGFVYLDITHHNKSFLQTRFPQIYQTLNEIGIDMSKDPIPVVPAAHYQCGGILTDIDGRTDLKRLFAIGETAFTGLHGANRLASNSLLEGAIMARNAAFACFKDITSPLKGVDNIPAWNSPSTVNTRRASQINAHWRGLRGEMTSYAGIVRTEAGLSDILQLIMKRKKIIEEYYWNHCITRDFIELRNIVLNAELIVRSALYRRESRGGHYREDYPNQLATARESILRRQAPHDSYIE
ncbi:L-aspartate oxidase [Legionella sp. W05-934-2]|jgi:L-aspartate oxidase|uniref:L-aspartate oxidase n=1 Tax=Legionella sp. W05-934-2 TaxID=1198649 RepID=UPI003461A355